MGRRELEMYKTRQTGQRARAKLAGGDIAIIAAFTIAAFVLSFAPLG